MQAVSQSGQAFVQGLVTLYAYFEARAARITCPSSHSIESGRTEEDTEEGL